MLVSFRILLEVISGYSLLKVSSKSTKKMCCHQKKKKTKIKKGTNRYLDKCKTSKY